MTERLHSFIFNLFSLEHYTHLVQYSNILKNSNKQIMTIKYLLNLCSLPTPSTLSINISLQTSSLAFSLGLTMGWTFYINLAFLPWPSPIPSFLKYPSSSASSTQAKNSQFLSSSCTKEIQNQSPLNKPCWHHIAMVRQTFGRGQALSYHH